MEKVEEEEGGEVAAIVYKRCLFSRTVYGPWSWTIVIDTSLLRNSTDMINTIQTFDMHTCIYVRKYWLYVFLSVYLSVNLSFYLPDKSSACQCKCLYVQPDACPPYKRVKICSRFENNIAMTLSNQRVNHNIFSFCNMKLHSIHTHTHTHLHTHTHTHLW